MKTSLMVLKIILVVLCFSYQWSATTQEPVINKKINANVVLATLVKKLNYKK